MLYYSLFAIIALLGFGEQFVKQRKNGRTFKYLFVVVLFVIFLLSAFRWERGSDWNSYLLFFRHNANYWDTHFEVGYTLLNKLFSRITDNYSVFLAFQAGLYLFLTAKFFNRINLTYPTDRTYLFSLLLYQFSGNFSGMFTTRSQIAGIICALAILNIREKKLIPFLIKVAIASTFHLSSIVFILAYVVYHLRIKERTYYIWLSVITIIGLVSPIIVLRVLSMFPQLQRYSVYLRLDSLGTISFGLLRWIILLVVMLLLARSSENNEGYGYSRVFAIGVVIYLWSSLFGSVLNRVSGLFLAAAYCMIPMLLSRFWGWTKMFVYLLFIAWCFLSFYFMFNGNYHDLFEPYKSIFDSFSVTTSIP